MVDESEDFVNEFKQQAREIMAKKDVAIPPQAASLIEEALIKIETENLSIKDALGFPQDLIEDIYENGFHLFQSGKYQDALSAFNLLRKLDGNDPRFTFAIAACHHKANNYVEAAGNYMLYEVLDPTNPLPYYHLYDCFTKMNQPLLGFDALKLAGRLAEQDPKYAQLKNKIEMELEHLQSLESRSEEKSK